MKTPLLSLSLALLCLACSQTDRAELEAENPGDYLKFSETSWQKGETTPDEYTDSGFRTTYTISGTVTNEMMHHSAEKVFVHANMLGANDKLVQLYTVSLGFDVLQPGESMEFSKPLIVDKMEEVLKVEFSASATPLPLQSESTPEE